MQTDLETALAKLRALHEKDPFFKYRHNLWHFSGRKPPRFFLPEKMGVDAAHEVAPLMLSANILIRDIWYADVELDKADKAMNTLLHSIRYCTPFSDEEQGHILYRRELYCKIQRLTKERGALQSQLLPLKKQITKHFQIALCKHRPKSAPK